MTRSEVDRDARAERETDDVRGRSVEQVGDSVGGVGDRYPRFVGALAEAGEVGHEADVVVEGRHLRPPHPARDVAAVHPEDTFGARAGLDEVHDALARLPLAMMMSS